MHSLSAATTAVDLYIPGRNEKNGEAIIYVRKVLREGGIAAIKGIGGFHLCCNALDDQAVRRLRRLKDRPMKPFAVMMRDMAAVRRECRILPGEEKSDRCPEADPDT